MPRREYLERDRAVRHVLPLLLLASMLSACDSGPAISKSNMGDLEINVSAPKGVDKSTSRLYIDGAFIGNVSRALPVLHLRRGERTVRVELEGHRAVERRILILGKPNHQVLNIVLQPE